MAEVFFLIPYSHQNFHPKKRYNPMCSIPWWYRSIPWIVRHGAVAKVEPKAWDLSSTEQEADWGYSFDHEGWSFSPANTAITGFRRSHDNNLYNLEARFLGKVGWFFYIRFCVDGGYIIRFFSQWEADYWRDLKQIGYLQNLQIQRIISPFGLGHKCRHKM